MSGHDPWTPPDDRSRAIYEYYLAGGTRGDLYVHFRRGRLGIMRPDRGYDNALAAWMAGRDSSLPNPSNEGGARG